MINHLFEKEAIIFKDLEFHTELYNCSYHWTLILGLESYDVKTLADGCAFGDPDHFILSAGEQAPIFFFDKSLQKVDYIIYKGWGLGPRLPKQHGKGAKYYYVRNPDGEINVVELTHWPLYLFRAFLRYISSQYNPD